jgi:hypothetical protein
VWPKGRRQLWSRLLCALEGRAGQREGGVFCFRNAARPFPSKADGVQAKSAIFSGDESAKVGRLSWRATANP